MGLRKIKKFFLKKALALYRKIRKIRDEEKAGFRAISCREAYFMEDKLTFEEKRHYCERKAYSQLGYFPNLDEPSTYNEKLIWLALNYKNPIIGKCTDKFSCKEYIKHAVGEKYCVPTIGVYDNANKIEWDKLQEPYVIKSTGGWASKQVIIANGKKIDIDKTKSVISSWLYPWNTYYYQNLCITDEKVKPRILIEKYIGKGSDVVDYKILSFNGVPRIILMVKNRHSKKMEKTFVDLSDFSVIPIKREGTDTDKTISRPECLDEMIDIAKKLSEDVPVLRVDFYYVDGSLYIGELTFSPGLFLKISPPEWDYKLGQFLDISSYF